jgi:hypothetical protein
MASQLEQLQSDIHYCYQCFQWVVGDHWEEHCQSHLQPITSKVCGTITYIHTLVRPGFCPFCLGNEALPATRRLESWTRDRKMWGHMNEHLVGMQWPCRCPHPLCDVSLEDEAALSFHFVDEHRLTHTRAPPPAEIRIDASKDTTGAKRKRNQSREYGALEWQRPEDFPMPSASASGDDLSLIRTPKRLQSMSPTICPSLISKTEYAADFLQSDSHTIVQSTTHDLEMTDWEAPLSRPRTPKGAASELLDEASTGHDSSDEILFSQYLRSPSPCLSVKGFSKRGGELPSTDTDSHVESLATPAARSGLDENVDDSQGKPHAAKDGLRIRLRIKPPVPRIMLRLGRPKTVTVAMRKRKRIG